MYSNHMGINKNYQTVLTRNLSAIQRDLRSNRITQYEFNILLGMIIKVEMNNFIKNNLSDINSDMVQILIVK